MAASSVQVPAASPPADTTRTHVGRGQARRTLGRLLRQPGGAFGVLVLGLLVLLARLFDTIFAFPSILLGIGLVAVLGSNIFNVAIAVAIINVPTLGRLTRVAM